MKCVILGDIAWRYLYHLGDEAMTEAAIDQLQGRDIKQITLVAGEPAVAEALYGTPAVARFGFSSKWRRQRLETELTNVTEGLARGKSALHESVQEADGVIIAGGGNMNSDYAYHLYERVAFKRLAEHYGKPLFVSSQTIGPMLQPRDRELIAEILAYASCFGVRESFSYELALELGGEPGRVVQTLDDAIMLRARETDYNVINELRLSRGYIVASFARYQGTTGLTDDEYVAQVAQVLDTLAVRFDADVALTPHTGSLDRSVQKGDQVLNRAVADASTSGRLKPLDMLTARQVVALTEGAMLSVSTRYHPTVFGPPAAVPTLGISLSYYASVRMRGSMSSVGLEHFVIPAACTAEIAAATEIVERVEEFRAHIGAVMEKRFREQSTWWDAIASAIRSGEWAPVSNLQSLPVFEATGEWSSDVQHVTPAFDLLGRERVLSAWLAQDGREAREAAKAADQKARQARRSLDAVKQSLKKAETTATALRQRVERAEKRAECAEKRAECAEKRAECAEERAESAEGRKAVKLANRVGHLTRKISRRSV